MKKLSYEIGVLVMVGIAITFLFGYIIYPALSLPSFGPVPIRTVILVGLATWFLNRSSRKWSEFGFSWSDKWWKLALAVLLLLAVKLFLAQPFSDWIRSLLQLAPSEYSFFAHIEGNTFALIAWLLVAWIAGGFAEEMLIRGYLMQRIGEVLGNTKIAWTLALLLQALIFGIAHGYAGTGAFISAIISALVFGIFVLISKRSIWPGIIGHGLWDSMGVILFYLNGVPTT